MKHSKFVKQMKESPILYIMLLINLFSITLLSLFNYVVFHNATRRTYLESFISYQESVANLAFSNIDAQILESAYHIPQLYFAPTKQNAAVLLPQNKNIMSSTGDIMALTMVMEEIRRRNPYVQSIDIYYEETQTVVTGFNKIHFVDNAKELYKYLPWYPEFTKQRQESYFFELGRYSYPTEAELLTYVQKIPKLTGSSSDILVALHITPDGFANYIDETRGKFAIVTRDHRLVYESPGGKRGGYGEGIVVFDREQGGENPESAVVSFGFESGAGAVTGFRGYSASTGLAYYYCVKNDTFYNEINIKNKTFLWNFLISIGFNILVLALVSYMNYMAYVNRIQFFSRIAGVTGEQKNKSVDGTLSAMSEKITNLSQTVKSSEALMFQNAVRSLILNRREEHAGEWIRPYLKFEFMRTFLFHVEDAAFDSISIEALQRQWNEDERFGVLLTTLEKGDVVAVLMFSDGSGTGAETAGEWLETMADGAFGEYRMESGCMLPLKTENLKSSYRSACEVFKYRYIFTKEKKLTFEMVGMEGRKASGSHLKLFAAIEKDLNSENLLDFKYHSEMLIVSFQSGNYTIEYCLSTLRDLVTIVYQTIQNNQLDMWVIVGYDIRGYQKNIADIEEFHQWMDELCEIVMGNIRQRKSGSDVILKDRLLSLIDQNLEKDISLEFLADKLSMRLDTLSRSFKQVMGKSYTEYVKGRKMERAVELLREDYSVGEIAGRLGYNSPQYFIKLFKEGYGVTPYQYKKELTEKNNAADNR